jgi:phosphoglycolate phosphatase-like HAD superfamily hydrolase
MKWGPVQILAQSPFLYVFDLDGTLLDRRRSFEGFVRDQCERFGHALKAVDREQWVRTPIERDCDGYAPRNELFTGIIAANIPAIHQCDPL